MIFKVILYNSTEYEAMVLLRMEVLRKPLGLTFSADDLNKEAFDLHLGAFVNDQLVACCVLTKIDNNTVQLRQMAVAPAEEGKDIGTALLQFAERIAIEHHFLVLIMHARKSAVGFYLKSGYHIEGEEYIEVGIPHYTMKKALA